MAEEPDFHEFQSVGGEDEFSPPTQLDDAASKSGKLKSVAAIVIGSAVLLGGIIGFTNVHASRPIVEARITPDPNAPQPAVDPQSATDPTPYPVMTRSPYSSFAREPQNTDTSPTLAQQENQAKMIALLRQQQAAQQNALPPQVPPIQNANVNPPVQAVTSIPDMPKHGRLIMNETSGAQVESGQDASVAGTRYPNQTLSAKNSNQETQNLQTQNTLTQRRFLDENQDHTGIGYVQHQSAYELAPTTVIPARLMTAINSDLPGPVKAQILQPIYDSKTHSIVVIPQGAMVFGVYDNAVVTGQKRLLIAWNEIIFPNGEDFHIGGMPGTDTQGASGFSGPVDQHRGELYHNAFLLTELGVAEGVLAPPQQSVLQSATIGQSVAQSAGAQLANIGNHIVDQQLQRPPTITISPPYTFNVFVTKPLPLDPYDG